MTSFLPELVAIALLILGNGVLSAIEIAIVSMRRGRARRCAEAGDPRAVALVNLRADPDRFFATIQIGITLVGALAGAVGGARIVHALVPILQRASWSAVAAAAEPLALIVVVGTITFATLILGELVPKSLGLRSAEAIALRAARPVLVLSRLLAPLVWLLTATSNVFLRPFGDRTSFSETRVSEAEIRMLLREGEEQGAIERRERHLLERVFHFGDARLRDVWVPRHELVALDVGWPEDEVRRVVLRTPHNRFPVYEGSLDRPLGYVTQRDFLACAWSGRSVALRELLHEAFVTRPDARATDVLQELQRRRQHLALVAGEDGLAGIVTIEDLVEELVGEIYGEHDQAPPAARVLK
jgi:putative hemolysin